MTTTSLPTWLGPLRCAACKRLDTLRLADADTVVCRACGHGGDRVWAAERYALAVVGRPGSGADPR